MSEEHDLAFEILKALHRIAEALEAIEDNTRQSEIQLEMDYDEHDDQ